MKCTGRCENGVNACGVQALKALAFSVTSFVASHALARGLRALVFAALLPGNAAQATRAARQQRASQ